MSQRELTGTTAAKRRPAAGSVRSGFPRQCRQWLLTGRSRPYVVVIRSFFARLPLFSGKTLLERPRRIGVVACILRASAVRGHLIVTIGAPFPLLTTERILATMTSEAILRFLPAVGFACESKAPRLYSNEKCRESCPPIFNAASGRTKSIVLFDLPLGI